MFIKERIFPRLNRTSHRNILSEVQPGLNIPRIIHQTFYDKVLPPELEHNVKQIREMNPNWDYRFYDDSDIVEFISVNYSPKILEYFFRIDQSYGAARADLFRYLLMFKVGGFYLDIKSNTTKPLDSVLHDADQFLLSIWNSQNGEYQGWGKHYELREFGGDEFQQWFIACSPGHPFLRSVIENVLQNIDMYIPILHGTGKNGVLRVTGPIAYSLAIHKTLSNHSYRIVDSDNDLGLKYSIFIGNSHMAQFKSHYSLQTLPIVKIKFIKNKLIFFYKFTKFVQRFVKTINIKKW